MDETKATTIKTRQQRTALDEPNDMSHWLACFDERQRRLIANCQTYAGGDPAGLPGHQLMLIVAEMFDMLERLDSLVDRELAAQIAAHGVNLMKQYIVKSDRGYVLDPNDLQVTSDVTLSARMDLLTAQRVKFEMDQRGFNATVEQVIVEDYSAPDFLIRLCGDGQVFIASAADFEDLQESSVVWLGRLERWIIRRVIRRLRKVTMGSSLVGGER